MLFWGLLERVGATAHVAAWWRAKLGPEYEQVKPLLRPRDRLARSYPRLDRADALAFRVVTHGPDAHYGVCPETGDRVALKTSDLVQYFLDLPAILRGIAVAFGLDCEGVVEPGCRGTYRLATYAPLAGHRFPVLVTSQPCPQALSQVVHRLAAQHDGPFLLVLPTARQLEPVAEEAMRRRRASVVALAETVELHEQSIRATPAWQVQIDAFQRSVLPQARLQDPLAFFLTPACARWSDVRIRFIDSHTVAINVRDIHGVYHYTQLGMVDGRNGRPSKQWELLQAFAENEGLLTWDSRQADRRNQKRKEQLSAALQRFFRIEGEPFWREGNGWRTLFLVAQQTSACVLFR